MHYVYVLRSKKDKNFYTGYTSDLKKRIQEHFNGESFATKARLPFELVYYESMKDRKDALAREKFLKTGWGRNFLERALKNYLSKT